MSELKDLKIVEKIKNKKFCVIDGIDFEPPSCFLDYLELGWKGIMLVIFSPVWLPIYGVGRIIKHFSKEKITQTVYKQVICPVCNSPTIIGDYKQAICKNCGWYVYT